MSKLTPEKIVNVAENILKENEITYDVRISDHNSIYITMHYIDTCIRVRISDHYAVTPDRKKIRTFIVKNNTRSKTVESFIRNAIDSLKKKATYKAFEKIEKGEKNGKN